MKTKSAKQKGRRLQNWVADQIRAWLRPIEPENVCVAIMGESGTDIKLSPLARQMFPFNTIECKNQEKINIWAAIKQAEGYGNKFLLFFKRNHSKTYVVMDAEVFFDVM